MIAAGAPREDAVVVRGLTKRFGDVTAVSDLSFTVRAGEVFGCIGPDGAGKTTLFRILVTLLVPDAGTATVLGDDVVTDLWSLRRRVGYMPGGFALYPDLSVEENLRFFASVFGTTIAKERAQIAPIYDQLAPFSDRRAGDLSGGMKQKLALCCALVHRPEILILDEPTTGVDAVSRREFWDLLGGLKAASGLTVIVSTPYMDEATRCDRVALMQRGRFLAVDTPAAITGAFDRTLFTVRSPERYRTLLALRDFPNVRTVFPFGETLHYTDRRADAPSAQVQRELAEFLASRQLPEATIAPADPTIEDSFIAAMGAPEGEEAEQPHEASR